MPADLFDRIAPGAWPVMFTPFTPAGYVDYQALDELADFYVDAGVAGLFVNCLSGEVFHLQWKEMVEIARRVALRVGGRAGVVSGANMGDTLEDQARCVDTMFGTGVDACVVILSALPSPHDLAGQLLELCDMTSAPLGLYECPVPEHRLLSPEEIGRIAPCGRFYFMKETSRSAAVCGEKVRAARDTSLKIYQASFKETPESLVLGAAGHCGVIANICPELTAALCGPARTDPRLREDVFRSLLAAHGAMTKRGYPASGKYILGKRGLSLSDFTRTLPPDAFTDDDRRALDAFFDGFDFLRPTPDRFAELPADYYETRSENSD